jgi:hypothetical protein
MSDISAPLGFSSGYVSDAELMGWLNEHSIDQNALLREMMQTSTVRTHLIQELTKIKGQVSANGHPDDVAKMIDDVKNNEEFKDYKVEIETLLGPTRDKLMSYSQEDAVFDIVTGALVVKLGGDFEPTRATMGDDAMKNDKAKLLEDLDGEINRLGTDDQMAMVQIQALSSQTREFSQLASNLMSSRSQARDGIVANIRG